MRHGGVFSRACCECTLDSDLGHRAILPLTCGLFGCMACMSVTQRRQRTAEEPLVGQGGQKRAFHKPMIVH